MTVDHLTKGLLMFYWRIESANINFRHLRFELSTHLYHSHNLFFIIVTRRAFWMVEAHQDHLIVAVIISVHNHNLCSLECLKLKTVH